jgi:hypothetical protein
MSACGSMQEEFKEHIICKYSKDCKQLEIDFIAKKKNHQFFPTLKFCAEYGGKITCCLTWHI